MSSEKKVTLLTSDQQAYEVKEDVASQSETIKNMIEEEERDNPVFPLPNVASKTLIKVIEYCKRHVPVSFNEEDEEAKATYEKELKNFDDEFKKIDDRDDLFELTLAANYLNIQSLLDLMCQFMADTIKDMRVEEVREYLNIENDFTPEEEAEIRNKYAWAFEDDKAEKDAGKA